MNGLWKIVNFDKAWILNKIAPSISDNLTSIRHLSKLIPRSNLIYFYKSYMTMAMMEHEWSGELVATYVLHRDKWSGWARGTWPGKRYRVGSEPWRSPDSAACSLCRACTRLRLRLPFCAIKTTIWRLNRAYRFATSLFQLIGMTVKWCYPCQTSTDMLHRNILQYYQTITDRLKSCDRI